MYVLIDATNAAAIAVSAEYNALAGLSVIQYANVDCVLVPLGQNKGFSQFDLKQLMTIGTGLGMTFAKSTAYPDAIKAVRSAIEAAEWLRFPFTKEQVYAQVANLAPGDDKPRYFNPNGDTPLPADAWHVSPQRNRRREDATYWVHFSSGWLKTATGTAGGASPGPASPAAAPGKRTSARPSAPPAPGGTTPSPKPRAAPSGPATRPKAGTSTGKVWELADQLSQKLEGKELRKAVISACEVEGINASTASVQFGKWKSSQ